MDNDILEAVAIEVTEPIEQTAEEAFASVMTAAINEGVAMDPAHAAAAMRKYLAEHDAGLIEQLAGTLPGNRSIGRLELLAEAERRRALS